MISLALLWPRPELNGDVGGGGGGGLPHGDLPLLGLPSAVQLLDCVKFLCKVFPSWIQNICTYVLLQSSKAPEG